MCSVSRAIGNLTHDDLRIHLARNFSQDMSAAPDAVVKLVFDLRKNGRRSVEPGICFWQEVGERQPASAAIDLITLESLPF